MYTIVLYKSLFLFKKMSVSLPRSLHYLCVLAVLFLLEIFAFCNWENACFEKRTVLESAPRMRLSAATETEQWVDAHYIFFKLMSLCCRYNQYLNC